jgi:hypothetical protein
MLTARLKKTPPRGARFGVITNLLLAGFSFYDRILLIYVIDFAGGEDPVGSGRGRKPQHPVLVESGHYAIVRFGWKADISSQLCRDPQGFDAVARQREEIVVPISGQWIEFRRTERGTCRLE